MSAPSYRSLEVENLTHGFMAAKVTSLLDRQPIGRVLSVDEEALLNSARDFVEKLAAGEELVETGVVRGQYARGSMKTLQLLSDPLQNLSQMGKYASVSAYLETLCRALSPELIKAGRIDSEELASARQFFDIVYCTLSAALSRNRHIRKQPYGRQGRRIDR